MTPQNTAWIQRWRERAAEAYKEANALGAPNIPSSQRWAASLREIAAIYRKIADENEKSLSPAD